MSVRENLVDGGDDHEDEQQRESVAQEVAAVDLTSARYHVGPQWIDRISCRATMRPQWVRLHHQWSCEAPTDRAWMW